MAGIPRLVLYPMLFMAVVLGGCGGKNSDGTRAKWQDSRNWERMETGLTEASVRDILGDPPKVEKTQYFTEWFFTDSRAAGLVTFTDGKVKSWRKPD